MISCCLLAPCQRRGALFASDGADEWFALNDTAPSTGTNRTVWYLPDPALPTGQPYCTFEYLVYDDYSSASGTTVVTVNVYGAVANSASDSTVTPGVCVPPASDRCTYKSAGGDVVRSSIALP